MTGSYNFNIEKHHYVIQGGGHDEPIAKRPHQTKGLMWSHIFALARNELAIYAILQIFK